MNRIGPCLPAETLLAFITSVRKAVEDHPDPKSDANLKEMERLARKIEADALRHHRKLQEEAKRQARAQQRKLEAAQRKENVRAGNREPGDFHSKPLI